MIDLQAGDLDLPVNADEVATAGVEGTVAYDYAAIGGLLTDIKEVSAGSVEVLGVKSVYNDAGDGTAGIVVIVEALGKGCRGAVLHRA